jgi:carboxyl-terminal processing protease
MSKKNSERKPHLLIIAFAMGLFIGINFSIIAGANEPAHKYLDYFHQVFQLVTTEFVDEPENKNLFYGAIRGMLNSLDDPYTRFLDEDASSELQEMTTGKFVGIGVEVTIRDGELIVVTPIENSPAMKEGIEAGDKITKVNDEPVRDKEFSEIIKKIKGLPGTKVNISIRRENVDEEITYAIERAPIKIDSVEYSIIKEHNYGYLKIKTFGAETASDVKHALQYFKENKIDSLIIDLRYNPGGLLSAAIEISDYFLDNDIVIVSTKGRSGKEAESVFKSKTPVFYSGKTVVLVNRGSASASEILSGALRDNKRAKLVGEKTFGKASVQKTFGLDKNVNVAITIAKYYTPSGELIHKKGITPDFEIKYFDIPESDNEGLKSIGRKRLLAEFVDSKTEYNKEARDTFKKILAENNIKLTQKTADYILKREIGKYHKSLPYELEFDNQLITAIEKLKK